MSGGGESAPAPAAKPVATPPVDPIEELAKKIFIELSAQVHGNPGEKPEHKKLVELSFRLAEAFDRGAAPGAVAILRPQEHREQAVAARDGEEISVLADLGRQVVLFRIDPREGPRLNAAPAAMRGEARMESLH